MAIMSLLTSRKKMSEKKLSSRERIVKAAVQLFSSRGITATTTKEIAEQAGVNEVTLFRQFGSKQGLLLAVMSEAPIVEKMQAALTAISAEDEPLVAYGETGLALLDQVSELVRSLIGEAGQSPPENRQALSQLLKQINQQTVDYLSRSQVSLPSLKQAELAGLLNTLLLGHAVIGFSGEDEGLWARQTDFLSAVSTVFQQGDSERSPSSASSRVSDTVVADLPAEVVKQLFGVAKKQGPQSYALVYVLFGAGLTLAEVASLTRQQIFSSKTQHLLTVESATGIRQVPVNRWIMGNRYGSYLKNPLTQWLKSRQDERPEVFVSEGTAGKGEKTVPVVPMSEEGLGELWGAIAADISSGTGAPLAPFQARQTWCIEMLMKGISLENLSILSGLSLAELAVYEKRAQEKAAVEAAIAIDQKTNS